MKDYEIEYVNKINESFREYMKSVCAVADKAEDEITKSIYSISNKAALEMVRLNEEMSERMAKFSNVCLRPGIPIQ